MLKKCEYCGREFETKRGHNNQRFCSKSCSAKSRYHDDLGLFRNDIDDYIQKYILGLIITDGCISKGYICISLKDKEMIEQIHNIVCPNKKVYKDGNNYQVKWRNNEDIKYLELLGIHERKTFNVTLPIFEDNMWHMIRGIFDGDGCVYTSKEYDKKYGKDYFYSFISITTASFAFAAKINKFFNDNGISSRIYLDKRTRKRKHKTYYIKIFKKDSVLLFKKYIYNDCSCWFLPRKLDKFIQ